MSNVATGEKLALTTKQDSYCHFAKRFLHDSREVGFRVDWGDLDKNGDPTLDTNLFEPGKDKPLKGDKDFREKFHHTNKSQNSDSGFLTYDFIFNGLRLQLLLELRHQQTQLGKGCIVSSTEKPAD